MMIEIVTDILHIATFAGAVAMLACEIVGFAKTKGTKARKDDGEEVIKQFKETCDYGCKHLIQRRSSRWNGCKYKCELCGAFDNPPLYCWRFKPKCGEEEDGDAS